MTEELEDHIVDQLMQAGSFTSSAFLDVLKKYLPEDFRAVFNAYTRVIPKGNLYKGHRLPGDDGSKVNLPYDPGNTSCYFEPKKGKGCKKNGKAGKSGRKASKTSGKGNKKSSSNGKGYNQMHLNACFDLMNGLFLSFSTQPGRKTDERGAMLDMVEKRHEENVSNADNDIPDIHIRDRGYEGYSIIASLLMLNELFLIRGRDISSSGIARMLRDQVTDDEFDVDFETTLTLRHTKETMKNHPELYKILNKNQWKYKLEGLTEYKLKLRIVRVKLSSGSYEILLTNLDREEFPPETLKEMYGIRWRLESAFRKLKYQIGLVFLHHKRDDFIEMEVCARMIFFNFCSAIYNKMNESLSEGRQTDFAYLVGQLRRYIQQGAGRGVYFWKKARKHTYLIRDGRTFERRMRGQSIKPFTNRG